MPPKREKPPAQSRAELTDELVRLMSNRYVVEVGTATRFLSKYFTSIDLVGIIKDIKDAQ